MRFAQGKLREGSGSPGAEILRCAQDDSPDPAPVRFREAFSPNISRNARTSGKEQNGVVEWACLGHQFASRGRLHG